MLFKILKLNFHCFSFWPSDISFTRWKTIFNICFIFLSVFIHVVSSIMVFRENDLPEALVSLGPATTEFLTTIKMLYILINFEKFKYIINKIIILLENSIKTQMKISFSFISIFLSFQITI